MLMVDPGSSLVSASLTSDSSQFSPSLTSNSQNSSPILQYSDASKAEYVLLDHGPRTKWLQPSGPRRPGEGTEDEIQGLVALTRVNSGGLLLKITLLAAGFVIGPSGISVRDIISATGADIRSWTESRPQKDVRPLRCFLVEGSTTSTTYALEVIIAAVNRYKELCEGACSGQCVSRKQTVCGVSFYYQPPPRSVVPFAASIASQAPRVTQTLQKELDPRFWRGPINSLDAISSKRYSHIDQPMENGLQNLSWNFKDNGHPVNADAPLGCQLPLSWYRPGRSCMKECPSQWCHLAAQSEAMPHPVIGADMSPIAPKCSTNGMRVSQLFQDHGEAQLCGDQMRTDFGALADNGASIQKLPMKWNLNWGEVMPLPQVSPHDLSHDSCNVAPKSRSTLGVPLCGDKKSMEGSLHLSPFEPAIFDGQLKFEPEGPMTNGIGDRGVMFTNDGQPFKLFSPVAAQPWMQISR